jgi:hypothetical protein
MGNALLREKVHQEDRLWTHIEPNVVACWLLCGDWTGYICTDSQSLLDQLFGKGINQEPQGYTSCNSTTLEVLVPEWDLLIEIQVSLCKLSGLHLKYVKGHQDAKKAYRTLPLMAQLNVDADGLATQYQEESGTPRPHVLMSPNAGVHLVTQDETLTAKYVPIIR